MRNIFLSVLLTISFFSGCQNVVFAEEAEDPEYNRQEVLLPASVVFTEVMADPEPVNGLTQAEYLELYNRSDEAVSLAGCTLNYGGKAYPLPASVVPAGEYAVLCSASSAPDFQGVRVLSMTSFPVLVNTGKLLSLSRSGQTIAWLDYSDRWYGSPFKSGGGWSLECIDPDNLSGSASNWKASVNPKGGTPGLINSVCASNPDAGSLLLTRLTVDKPEEISLHFDRFVNPLLLENSWFTLSPYKTLVVRASANPVDQRVVRLTLSDSLLAGELYNLQITDLFDLAGKSLTDTSVMLGLPATPVVGDVLFNELLFNPKQEGVDYVELVSVADRCVDFSKIRLCRRLEDGNLSAPYELTRDHIPVPPQTLWLITSSPEAVYKAGPFPVAGNVMIVNELPSMPDDAGTLILTSFSGQILDSVSYSKTMHFPLIQNPEGVSLEKIRPDLPSGKRENWTSASSLSNFGTPGFVNSHTQPADNNSGKGFSVRKNWCTPDNDGVDDAVEIVYCFDQPTAGRVCIFSLNGQLVRRLSGLDLFGNRGVLCWDGCNDAGALVSPGRYILFTETQGKTGMIQKKLALTVLF